MNFSDLGLSKRTVVALEKTGLVEPTEIQSRAIPLVIEGRDLMASAETGSGKTAAYALPIIENIISSSMKQPRVLVLVPTRELAIQVETQFQRFSRGSGMRSVTVYGGAGFERQQKMLHRGVDVVVATPGRLKDHLDRGNVDLSKVNVLVLDEADRMLDMGFMPQVRQILKTVPTQRQTLLFSATFNESVERSAAEFLKKPERIQINSKRLEPISIDQKIFHVDESSKDELLVKLVGEVAVNNSILVFARTRRKVTKIKKRLCASNVLADEIHGDISQNKRERTLTRYRDGEFTVLVATDVAARGLDIPAISHVVNYDLPDNAEDYVHRIGRTGRAGRSGSAISFVSAGQRSMMRDIEKVTGRRFEGDSKFVGSNPPPQIPGEIPGLKMEGSRRYKAERGEGRPPRAERNNEFDSGTTEVQSFDGQLTESSKYSSAPKTDMPNGSNGTAGDRSRGNKSNGSFKSGGKKSESKWKVHKPSGTSRNRTGETSRSNSDATSRNRTGGASRNPSGESKSTSDGISKKLKRRHFGFGKTSQTDRDPVVVW